jgi:flagellar assembly protein FliH
MTSSSPEPRLVREEAGARVATAFLGAELRSGNWTRLGRGSVLGDLTTEATLDGLAERSRKAARAQGYAQGWAEGRRAAEVRAQAAAEELAQRRAEGDRHRQAEHATTLRALEDAATQLRQSLSGACAAVESHVVEAALQIAEAVVGRELALAEDPAADALRRALRLLPPDTTAFTVRLNREDSAGLDSEVLAGHTATVVADPAVSRGEAVVETDTFVIDAGVDAALERVRAVLTS